ncbi:MAG: SDR family NAD(P)-dependent oxidoreductase [Sandaracinus sp.]|nr:SDR family NAD(P)-dependent oxidoreductase [Sandaracinus sp.]
MALTDQIPTQSGFHGKSTGDEVLEGLDLRGKVAVITGGYSGIGLETTRSLVAKGARVIVPARAVERAKETLGSLAEVAPMDLADLGSVRAFAASLELPKLDYLLLNAGVMACPETRVGPGWESQLAVNHFGHFALTAALMDLVRASEGIRVICLSSAAHKLSGMRWDDLHFTTGYDKWKAYGQSKTANALFANGLSRRLRDSGGLAFSLHPGAIFTPLQRHLPLEEQQAMGWVGEDGQPTERAKSLWKTPEQGCSTTLWAATSPKLEGKPGVYCEDCDVAAPTSPSSPRFTGVDAHACDDDDAERLWELTEAALASA